MTIKDYINTLSDTDKLLIIKDYEELNNNNLILNDSFIRKHLITYLNLQDLPYENILLHLDQLALESYKYFAYLQIQYIKQKEHDSLNMPEETYKYNVNRIQTLDVQQLMEIKRDLNTFFRNNEKNNYKVEQYKQSNYNKLLQLVNERLNYLAQNCLPF